MQRGRSSYSFTTLQLPVNRKIDMTEDLRFTTVTVNMQRGRSSYSFTTLQLPVNRKIDMTEDLRVTTVTVQVGLLLRQHAAWAQ
ncbi:hypothetical protein J6590_051867 [Homalodisca vitripennis]|nr:hypothetical protein J6590_051867 [Homalodisca vitripennis]